MYSSGFASGSVGGRQPGPPAGLLPASLGQVRVNTFLHKMLADYSGMRKPSPAQDARRLLTAPKHALAGSA